MGLHSLIFRAHSTSRYSIAALLGSIETDPRLTHIKVIAPIGSIERAIEQGLKQGSVIVAHSVMSTQLDRVKEELQTTRGRFGKDVVMIAGGPHASSRPGELLDIGFDYVAIGEGESIFREFLWHMDNDRDPTTIPGIVGQDSHVFPAPRELERVVLDKYPPFAIGLNIVGPVEVTRGCPFRCKFCATPFLTGGVVRHRGVESVTRWLKRAVREKGFERTWFLSPNALCYGGRGRKAEPEKLERLLKNVTAATGIDVFFGSFPSEVRPEFVTHELLEMVRRYVSNRTLQIGLQSGSDRILLQANRHHTVQEGVNAVEVARDAGFIPHVDMIFGLPFECQDDVDASLQMCRELVNLGAKIHAHVFMPLPGSEWENMPAGLLNTRTRQLLGELARKKKVTGSWGYQESLGRKLQRHD